MLPCVTLTVKVMGGEGKPGGGAGEYELAEDLAAVKLGGGTDELAEELAAERPSERRRRRRRRPRCKSGVNIWYLLLHSRLHR